LIIAAIAEYTLLQYIILDCKNSI